MAAASAAALSQQYFCNGEMAAMYQQYQRHRHQHQQWPAKASSQHVIASNGHPHHQ